MASNSYQNEVPKARVNIRLDLHTGGAQQKLELPLKLMVMGDYSNGREQRPLSERRKVDINKGNFNQVLAEYQPALNLDLGEALGGQGYVDLNFRDIKDFEPEQVARQIPQLRAMLAMRNLLVDQTDFRQNVRIELLDVSKEHLVQDFEDAPEIAQSGLYFHTYVQEYDIRPARMSIGPRSSTTASRCSSTTAPICRPLPPSPWRAAIATASAAWPKVSRCCKRWLMHGHRCGRPWRQLGWRCLHGCSGNGSLGCAAWPCSRAICRRFCRYKPRWNSSTKRWSGMPRYWS